MDRLGDHGRLRDGHAAPHRAVLVVDHADCVDRVHHLRRFDRLSCARRLVDSIRTRRVRAARARVDSAVARVRVVQPLYTELALHGIARELLAPAFRLRVVVRNNLTGDLRRRGIVRGPQGRTGGTGRRGGTGGVGGAGGGGWALPSRASHLPSPPSLPSFPSLPPGFSPRPAAPVAASPLPPTLPP